MNNVFKFDIGTYHQKVKFIHDESYQTMLLHFHDFNPKINPQNDVLYRMMNDGENTTFTKEKEAVSCDYVQYLGDGRIFKASQKSKLISINNFYNSQVIVQTKFEFSVKHVVSCNSGAQLLAITTHRTQKHVYLCHLQFFLTTVSIIEE